MSLSERLRAAAIERGEEPADAVDVDLTTDSDAGDGPLAPVIVLRDAPVWGRPGRCRDCGGPGYLDYIDLVQGTMGQRCPECGTRWVTRREETVRAR